VSTLLPAGALRGTCIGISVAESPDLERLGLLEIHFRLAMAEIARSVLVSGGTLAYMIAAACFTVPLGSALSMAFVPPARASCDFARSRR